MSSSSIVVAVREASKRYYVYDAPHVRLLQFAISAANRLTSTPIFRNQYREFWALKQVSFELERGGSLGIVGRNGAGKSTLMQLIAGTVSATAGSIECHGRIGALLELGAGFNPEFTGRENLRLNAAINGYERSALDAVVESAIEFADIGSFIEQPVKTYSSGMFARVAFAGSISIKPDLLLVDEILAVGDLAFQQRCIGRLREMRDKGLALLLVSHSPDMIKSVCEKALFLRDGSIVDFGPSDRVVDHYLSYIRHVSNDEALKLSDLGAPMPFESRIQGSTRYGSGHAQLQGVKLVDDLNQSRLVFAFNERVTVLIRLRALIELDGLSVSFLVRDSAGIDIFGSTSFEERVVLPTLGPGRACTIAVRFNAVLRPGSYGLSVAINRVTARDLTDNVLLDQVDGVAAFSVAPNPERPVHYKVHLPVEFEAMQEESRLVNPGD